MARLAVLAVWALGALGCSSGCSTDSAVAAASPPPASSSSGGVTPSRAAIRARAHDVLARRCGECHESHRPTSKPPALAIFDLDKPDWPSRFDARRFETGLRRFGTKPDQDTSAFVALRDAELGR